MSVSIGVVGYSQQSFDEGEARKTISEAFDEVVADTRNEEYEVVSGYTALGVPRIAYEVAEDYGWKTVGLACEKATNFETYPVDESVLVGTEWGDESERLIQRIDVLVRVGGGRQAEEEVQLAKDAGVRVLEYDL